MKVIDAQHNLKHESIQEFLNEVNEDIILVDLDTSSLELTKTTYIELFMNHIEEVKEYFNSHDSLMSATENVCIMFSKDDYLWWTKSTRQTHKLFNISSQTKTEEKKKKVEVIQQDKTYKVACGVLNEDDLSQITTCEGSKNDIVNFMNDELRMKSMQNFFKGKVVFNFNYDEDKSINILEWETIDELVERGVVTLK